jgi:hypothetical protein
MWNSPFVRLLGIATVPANIVCDSTGHIVARNLEVADMEKTIKELIKK